MTYNEYRDEKDYLPANKVSMTRQASQQPGFVNKERLIETKTNVGNENRIEINEQEI